MTTLLMLLLVIAFSAFFSGMEIAYVSVEKMRLEVNKSRYWTAPIVDYFQRHSSSFISTMLVGNNVALVIYGIITAALIDSYILKDPEMNELLRLLLETLISTVVIIFFGEFIPKTLFKINPNLVLNIFSPVLLPIYFLLFPVSWFCQLLSGLILRLFGMSLDDDTTRRAFSKVDLDDYISSSIDNAKDSDQLKTEVRIFRNVLDFAQVRVRDCMVPRTEMVICDKASSKEHLMELFVQSGLSKILVQDGSIDNIIGYIHSWEMFRCKDDWTSHLLPVQIVPETMSADHLMKLFMQQKRTIAVVVDEFGGTSGLVTLEDLVEEIFGEIEDEHDNPGHVMKRISDTEYELSARLEIDRINEALGLDLPVSDDYVTLNGLILSRYQSLPKLHQVISVGRFDFKILSVSANRIDLVGLKVR